jgi:hypothetical protein
VVIQTAIELFISNILQSILIQLRNKDNYNLITFNKNGLIFNKTPQPEKG